MICFTMQCIILFRVHHACKCLLPATIKNLPRPVILFLHAGVWSTTGPRLSDGGKLLCQQWRSVCSETQSARFVLFERQLFHWFFGHSKLHAINASAVGTGRLYSVLWKHICPQPGTDIPQPPYQQCKLCVSSKLTNRVFEPTFVFVKSEELFQFLIKAPSTLYVRRRHP